MWEIVCGLEVSSFSVYMPFDRKYLEIREGSRPGQETKWLFLIAFTEVDLTGAKYAVCSKSHLVVVSK